MGNCLRLGISRVGLAWSKWRMSAKFKRKSISILILGMQAVGKSTIALRLYKFKRALPDTNYVQTKGFSTYTVKRKKTTINVYDLGGHPSIQELWDHYYADAHGIIFVVDTSDRDSLPEAGRLLYKVLSDHRIRRKPVLLLANKIDLDGVSEIELDSMLNLQQVVNSVRCLTRVDVSCATDLKNDKGIFEGFDWLVSYIESNFVELNDRVLSDSMEEKNREKARREAVKAARLADKEAEEIELEANGTPVLPASPSLKNSPPVIPTPPTSAPARKSMEDATIPNLVQDGEDYRDSPTHKEVQPSNGNLRRFSPPLPISKPEVNLAEVLKKEPAMPHCKIPLPLLPPVNTVSAQLIEQPIKLPRLKSPKSRPEVISRIEDNGSLVRDDGTSKFSSSKANNPPTNDQYYNEKGFRFRQISAARRLSPEGADSDDGIVNMAYEPTEDISSDSTPIGGRRHNFSNNDLEFPNKELFMVTTMAEVHKEYFKDRKGSTSTHDSISMSMASEATDSINEDGQSGNVSFSKQEENIPLDSLPKKSSSTRKVVKSKKRLNIKSRHNKTAPLPPEASPSMNLPPTGVGAGGEANSLRHFPPSSNTIPLEGQDNQLGQGHSTAPPMKQNSRGSSASSMASSLKAPFTVGNAWERNSEIPEVVEAPKVGTSADAAGEKY